MYFTIFISQSYCYTCPSGSCRRSNAYISFLHFYRASPRFCEAQGGGCICEAFFSLPFPPPSPLSFPSLSFPAILCSSHSLLLPLEVGPLNVARVWGGAPAEIVFGAFYPYNMTSGGNNFSNFPESYCDFYVHNAMPLRREAEGGGLTGLPKGRHGTFRSAAYRVELDKIVTVFVNNFFIKLCVHSFGFELLISVHVQRQLVLQLYGEHNERINCRTAARMYWR